MEYHGSQSKNMDQDQDEYHSIKYHQRHQISIKYRRSVLIQTPMQPQHDQRYQQPPAYPAVSQSCLPLHRSPQLLFQWVDELAATDQDPFRHVPDREYASDVALHYKTRFLPPNSPPRSSDPSDDTR